MHVTLGQIVAAAIAAVPAIAAAWNSHRSKRNTDTTNGTNLGAMVEELRAEFYTFKAWVEAHMETPSGDKLGEVVERTHDLAAVTVAATTKKEGGE